MIYISDVDNIHLLSGIRGQKRKPDSLALFFLLFHILVINLFWNSVFFITNE